MSITRLTLRLFGRFEGRWNGEPLSGLHLRDGERLLAYLALRQGEEISYRELAERFWPAEARMHAMHGGDFGSTRQAIRSLRVALGDAAGQLESVGKGVVRLSLSQGDADFLQFDSLVASSRIEDQRAAIALYTSPLLEGWSDAWVRDARARRKREYERVLRSLAKTTGEMVFLRQLLLSTPTDEPALCTLLQHLADVGQSEEAREVAGVFQEAMQRAGREPGHMAREWIAAIHQTPSGSSLASTLTEPVPPPDSVTPPAELASTWEPIGGAIGPESHFYIERPSDAVFHAAVARHDSIVLVKGARQMGKTSLLARGLHQARKQRLRILLTDFQAMPDSALASPETLYFALATQIAEQLDLDHSPRKDWDDDFYASINLERFLRRRVFSATQPVIWGLDEVDRLFNMPFYSEVFGLFRSWHNRRALDPNTPWSQLTLVICYATEAHLFISTPNQSPFNVGTHITLRDFDRKEVTELNRRYGDPLRSEDQVTRFQNLFDGHPYLIRQGLHELATNHATLDDLEQHGHLEAGPFGNHLRRLRALLTAEPALADALQALIHNGASLTSDTFYRLRSAGLIAGDSPHDARPRCRLYANYLR